MGTRFELRGEPGFEDGSEFVPIPGMGIIDAVDQRGRLMVGTVGDEFRAAPIANIMIVQEVAR